MISAATVVEDRRNCPKSSKKKEVGASFPAFRQVKVADKMFVRVAHGDMEGKRMVSGFIGNEVPRKGLRVRISCPPLIDCI